MIRNVEKRCKLYRNVTNKQKTQSDVHKKKTNQITEMRSKRCKTKIEEEKEPHISNKTKL